MWKLSVGFFYILHATVTSLLLQLASAVSHALAQLVVKLGRTLLLQLVLHIRQLHCNATASSLHCFELLLRYETKFHFAYCSG